MIPDVDNILRTILEREMQLRKGEVEITFDQPRREWSARLNKPTINLYMFDVRENLELRGSEQPVVTNNPDGTYSVQHNPLRIDLLYLLTGWAREVQDEHRLLSEALTALLRYPFFPEDLLPESLKGQPTPVRLEVAHHNILEKITDLWTTLDNELHPGVRLMVTISLAPFRPETVKPVATTELRYLQEPSPEAASGKPAPSKKYFTVKGRVLSQKFSTSVLKLVVAETGKSIELRPDGQFKIGRLQPGEYHIDVLANERVLKHQKFQVPSPVLEINL